MADYRSLIVRSARRVRVIFGAQVDATLFSLTDFTVACDDGSGADPDVIAVLASPDSNTEVELALSLDLVEGARYTIHLDSGIYAPDLSTTPEASDSFTVASAPRAPADGFTNDDLNRLLFGEDLVHMNGDHVEGADGDLAVVGGPENARGAVERRVVSGPLPHRPDYGDIAEEFVDAPESLLDALRGRLERQARLDPRVIDARLAARAKNDGNVYIEGNVVLIGQVPVAVSVPVGR